MGKKKQFVDKNAAGTYTFQVVHRSQRDPRLADEDASAFVLQPVVPLNVQKRGPDVSARTYEAAASTLRSIVPPVAEAPDTDAADEILDPKYRTKAQQAMLGIFYDDDYDYSQHLRDVGGADAEMIEADPNDVASILRSREPSVVDRESKAGRLLAAALGLPDEALPSAHEEEIGLLNRAAIGSGPNLDLDPDIVAALDDGVDFGDPENMLDDDFITQAQTEGDAFGLGQGDGDQTPTNGSEGEEDEDDIKERQWRRIGHNSGMGGNASQAGPMARIRSPGGSCGSEDGEQSETRSRFTEYSMSSSILPRSEQQQRQDDHFEMLYAQYDEDQVGALDEDFEEEHSDAVGTRNIANYQGVIDDFYESNCQPDSDKFSLVQLIAAVDGVEDRVPREKLGTVAAAAICAEEDTVESQEEHLMEAIPYRDKRTKEWDCESILSTRSTLYNHPTIIEERRPRRPRKVELHPRSGIPLEPFQHSARGEGSDLPQNSDEGWEASGVAEADAEADAEEPSSTRGQARPKEESAEDKRARKHAVKEERRQRRGVKKATKSAFKTELARQAGMGLAPALKTVSLTG